MTTLAVNCEMTALDFETTGVAPGFVNTPWQIGLVEFTGGKVVRERHFTSLLRVPAEQPFNVYTPGRWAQQREAIAAAPTLPELWPELQPFLTGRPLIAHHAPTEQGVLRQCLPLQAFGPWVDTLAIARHAWPGRRDYKLESLIADFGLTARMEGLCPGLAPHDALYDAVACALLLECVMASPSWRSASVENLAHLR
jgi:DNA polymerase-3 subunit epsilon